MFTTTILNKSISTLVPAIDYTLKHSFVTGCDVSPYAGSSSDSVMTIHCKNAKNPDTKYIFRVYISAIGELFSPYDALYSPIKTWINNISSRERQHDRNNQIRDELFHAVALKFEPMASI
jgi:hypothetical protein